MVRRAFRGWFNERAFEFVVFFLISGGAAMCMVIVVRLLTSR